MLVEQIDYLGPEPFERSIGDLLDVLRPAIQAGDTWAAVRLHPEAELGGDDYFLAYGGKALANQFLVRERPVHFGGIKESDAPVHCYSQQRDHLFLVCGWAVSIGHAHTTKADGRYFQIALSKFALLHEFSVRRLNRQGVVNE